MKPCGQDVVRISQGALCETSNCPHQSKIEEPIYHSSICRTWMAMHNLGPGAVVERIDVVCGV